MKDSEVKKKKKWPKVLLTIVIIIAVLAGCICFNASRNMKVMNNTLDAGMETISEYAKLTPVDAGEYKQITMYGAMKFDVSQYDIEDIGNLSVMKVNMGFMQMVSYIITHFNHPREVSEQAVAAVRLLIGSGVIVKNQTVLLKGVNDDPEVLALLLHR